METNPAPMHRSNELTTDTATVEGPISFAEHGTRATLTHRCARAFSAGPFGIVSRPVLNGNAMLSLACPSHRMHGRQGADRPLAALLVTDAPEFETSTWIRQSDASHASSLPHPCVVTRQVGGISVHGMPPTVRSVRHDSASSGTSE